jgi:hypothetical protein
MSSKEKLRPIEQLWVCLTNSESDPESPSWHYDALRQTASGTRAARSILVDWQTAKRELRKRAQ